MNTGTQQTIAGILAQRLGVEPTLIEGTLGDQPLAAMMALSLLERHRSGTCDPVEIVHFVAALVGACPTCLGEDGACTACGGRGAPGSREPDAAALTAWITPSLRRLGLCVGRPWAGSAPDTHKGGYES